MLRNIVLCVLLLFTFSGTSQETNSNTIPKKLERKFRRDASRLALRMMSKKEELRYQNIFIPKDSIEILYEALTDIYLSDETAQSIAKCNVHTFPNPSIDRFNVIFDKNVNWAVPLQEGASETDSDEINDILFEYDLIIEKHVQWNSTQDAITIRSKSPLNMAALSNEFYNIEGVAEIDLCVPKVAGNDIEVERTKYGFEITYILRLGSYVQGKGKKHIWKYKWEKNGETSKITFISETGDPIPTWMRC